MRFCVTSQRELRGIPKRKRAKLEEGMVATPNCQRQASAVATRRATP